MSVSPVVVIFFLIGIFVNSLGRLILTPLHYPIGLPLTTIGYLLWAASYLYITVCALITRRFNAHIAFWLIFTALAPVQYMAAQAHHDTLNRVTAVILIAQLGIGSFIETGYYLRRRRDKKQLN